MRRLLLVSSLVGCMSSWAAASAQTMSGCGLGFMLLSHDSDSRAAQIFGATTNGTFGTQTFGITSGTSGCNKDGVMSKGREAEAYAEVNFDSLRREMAHGRGEYVETFASLLETPAWSRSDLLQLFQTEYTALYPSSQTTPVEMLRTLSVRLEQKT